MFERVCEGQCVQEYLLRLLVIIYVVWYTCSVILIVRLIKMIYEKYLMSYSTFSQLGFQIVFIVFNIITPSLPSISVVFLISSDRIDKRLHTLIIRTVIFLKIHYIELISVA